MSGWRAAAFAPALILAVASARADEARSCADDAERAQELRDGGKLLAARDLFVRCAQPTCAAAVKRECARWLDETTQRIPTIVPSAREESGEEVTDAKVSIDGAPIALRAAGSAVPLDPGPHTVRFEAPGRAPSEVRVVAHEGEHVRVVSVTFLPTARPHADAPPPPVREAPVAAPPSRVPALAYVTGAGAVVGLGVWAVAGVLGVVDYGHLKDRCSPDCAHDDVTRARTELAVASIGLAVGLVCAAATVVLFLSSRPRAASALVVPGALSFE
jgi:hypothetical protein